LSRISDLRRLDPGGRLRRADLAARVTRIDDRLRAEARAARRSAKPTLAFYGSAPWKKLMREIIAERGRRCQDPACRTSNRGQGQRVYGDHIRELADGGEALDKANVLLRCATCHGRKTAAARAARQGAGHGKNLLGEASTARRFFA
jgi:5-methylcytosine-specific restriction protein A